MIAVFQQQEQNQFNGGLQPVTAKPAIIKEFVLSNLRGTLAIIFPTLFRKIGSLEIRRDGKKINLKHHRIKTR